MDDKSKNAKPEANYFVSGSNNAGEIEGLSRVGWNVGVSANRVREPAAQALEALAGNGTKVFVDSGAFSEVTFERGRPEVKKLISEDEWLAIFGLYLRLARKLGSQLYVVAPDMVAFQKESLDRLATWSHVISALVRLGANVIVPVQKGTLSMAAFAERAMRLLGVRADQVVWGIPSKKDATSVADLREFSTWLGRQEGTTKLHLLGLGVMSRDRYAERVAAVAAASPATVVFSDSVRITAMVGRNRRPDGTIGKPRKLTAALDEAKATGLYRTCREWKRAAVEKVFGEELRALRAAA